MRRNTNMSVWESMRMLCNLAEQAPLPLNALIDPDLAQQRGIVPGAEVWVDYMQFHILSGSTAAGC